ncbi:MAG: outer membrane lipocarrier LolA family protein [Alphaproteobacteria bacterium]|nr:outer membrane lipocarrier LolA family protein [Alphaproteobacteria bacterium]HCQ70702.1 outer membrane lipoprotein carrier protein LolA [Rhodospirillaceae bacterium]|tara:strand:+ start:30525 stop:31148 length:624 start_codon:yes stop_codon:yes gene_type:complete
MFKRYIFAAILMGLLLQPRFVLAGDPADFQPEVQKAEHYLDTMTTAKARFVQTAHNGMQLVGTFFLDRPGKLRFEYDDPIEDFVMADGYFIYFYDSELGEQMNMPIGQSLADFILRKEISFSDDVIVSDVSRTHDLLQVKLVQKSDPESGSLILGFREEPFALKKWRVVDAQNLITEVELFYLETGIELDQDMFRYSKPDEERSYNE